MTGAPAPVDERQLRELGIRVDAPPALGQPAHARHAAVRVASPKVFATAAADGCGQVC